MFKGLVALVRGKRICLYSERGGRWFCLHLRGEYTAADFIRRIALLVLHHRAPIQHLPGAYSSPFRLLRIYSLRDTAYCKRNRNYVMENEGKAMRVAERKISPSYSRVLVTRLISYRTVRWLRWNWYNSTYIRDTKEDRERIGAIRCDSVLAYSSIRLEERLGTGIPSRLTDSKGGDPGSRREVSKKLYIRNFIVADADSCESASGNGE